MRKLIVLTAALLVAVPGVVLAASPKKGGTYEGKIDPVGDPQDLDTSEPRVSLKVSSSGEKVATFRFPEICGFNTSSASWIRGIKISDKGKFSGKREHTERIDGARG